MHEYTKTMTDYAENYVQVEVCKVLTLTMDQMNSHEGVVDHSLVFAWTGCRPGWTRSWC